jgi:hypothetical protein
MLYATPETPKPKRLQGAFVSEAEIKRIIRTIKEEADEPCYIDGITEKQKVGGLAGAGFAGTEQEDDLFDEAMTLVAENQKASTSFLQRKLGIGYGRAAKLLDALAEAGVVSEASGPKGREVLITREQFEQIKSRGMSAMPIHRREESKPLDSYLGDEEEDEEEEDEGDIEEEEDDDRGDDDGGEQGEEDEDAEDEERDEDDEEDDDEDSGVQERAEDDDSGNEKKNKGNTDRAKPVRTIEDDEGMYFSR